MMLQACLIGARPANTPGLPVTDGQIARDAAAGAIRVMIEMDHGDLASAAPMAQVMRARLGKALPALPLLLHGFDDTAWDFIAMARDWRCDTRMGMEDCLHLPDGRPGRNAALIAAANTILTAH